MGEFDEDFPLWRFSVDFYGRPNAAQTLLELQDKSGADVNLILFGLWRATENRVLSPNEYMALDIEVSEWRQCAVLPARKLRRGIKDFVQDSKNNLYIAAKALELSLERVQQWRLHKKSNLAPGSYCDGIKSAALNNLAVYTAVTSAPISESSALFLAELTEAVAK